MREKWICQQKSFSTENFQLNFALFLSLSLWGNTTYSISLYDIGNIIVFLPYISLGKLRVVVVDKGGGNEASYFPFVFFFWRRERENEMISPGRRDERGEGEILRRLFCYISAKMCWINSSSSSLSTANPQNRPEVCLRGGTVKVKDIYGIFWQDRHKLSVKKLVI